jgi:hypothetical protein
MLCSGAGPSSLEASSIYMPSPSGIRSTALCTE